MVKDGEDWHGLQTKNLKNVGALLSFGLTTSAALIESFWQPCDHTTVSFTKKTQPLVDFFQFPSWQLMAASRKQVEELQRAHDQKIKEQMIIDEKKKLMESQQVTVCMIKLGSHYLYY